MKSIIIVFLFVGITLFYSGCSDNPSAPGLNQTDQVTAKLDKKPAPALFCTTVYHWVGTGGLAWEGEIHGDIEGVIKWYFAGIPLFTGQASHYVDRFEIYTDAGFLVGEETGSTTARFGKNSNWRTNGIVTEASEEFEDWIGRMNHAEGHFTWSDFENGIPDQGTGTFRIN